MNVMIKARIRIISKPDTAPADLQVLPTCVWFRLPHKLSTSSLSVSGKDTESDSIFILFELFTCQLHYVTLFAAPGGQDTILINLRNARTADRHSTASRRSALLVLLAIVESSSSKGNPSTSRTSPTAHSTPTPRTKAPALRAAMRQFGGSAIDSRVRRLHCSLGHRGRQRNRVRPRRREQRPVRRSRRPSLWYCCAATCRVEIVLNLLSG